MKFSELPTHHALLITHGNRSACADLLWKELSHLSPVHRYFNQTVLDIETAREIISWAQSPYEGERIALVSFHTAGVPAQNALLKVLEEPRQGTRFIIVTTHKKHLIDTVLSRVHHRVHQSEEREEHKHAEDYLKTAPAARMKLPYIADMLARVDEEGRKNREAVKEFILSLVKVGQEKDMERRFIAEALECASYVSDPSASGKALLEYLSLLLPVAK